MSDVKVAIIDPVGGHGGMDYYCYGLAYGLGQNNVSVRYFTCDLTTTQFFDNVQTVLGFKKIWSGGVILRGIKYLAGHFEVFRSLSRNKMRLIHLHFFALGVEQLAVLVMARLFRLQTIVTLHDVNSFYKSSNKTIARVCLRLISGIIVHNQSSFNSLMLKDKQHPPVAVIPHGNYLPFIKCAAQRKERGPIFSLLFFGQIKKTKGLDLLLQAVANVKKRGLKIHLVVVGKPWKTDINHYLGLIDQLNLADVVETCFKFIPNEKVADYYQAADLVVLPYTEIYQSGVLLLSMSYGRSVLCSDLPAFKEVVEHQVTGLIFKSGDIESLTDKIVEAVNCPDLLQKISAGAGRLMRDKFDWVQIGAETKRFYSKVFSAEVSDLPND